MKEIPLTRGKVALVSDHRYDRVAAFKWCAVYDGKGHWYGRRSKDDVRLHRFILDVTDPEIKVDHVDGNGLNCQDENLRMCTHAENLRNRKVNRDSTSGFKGVYWSKGDNKYRAQIVVSGTHISLGSFVDPVEAALAYDEAARKYHGEFAHTNF